MDCVLPGRQSMSGKLILTPPRISIYMIYMIAG